MEGYNPNILKLCTIKIIIKLCPEGRKFSDLNKNKTTYNKYNY